MKQVFVGLSIMLFLLAACSSGPSQESVDAFAKCVTDSGAKFYGAFWCPHCKDQKKDFGRSMKYVTYIECAEPSNPNAVTTECQNAGIQSYPTWIFGDGSRESGRVSFEEIAQRTGCPAP